MAATAGGDPALRLENAALRHQLDVYQRSQPRPRIQRADRIFWVLMARRYPGWRDALYIVKPATVVSWHRMGFKALWRWRSHRRPGRPRLSTELRALIRQMAHDNPRWGAPRVHGELLKFGFDISERTVSRYLPRRPRNPARVQSWRTFLANHREILGGMDFLVVPTLRFQLLYVLVIVDHARRTIRHTAVTAHPTAAWVVQQLRDAFPWDTGRRRKLIFDNDAIFGRAVTDFLEAAGVEAVRIGYRSPWQNGVVERCHGTLRRELLDHVIPLSETHLRRLLTEFTVHYNFDRTHLTLGKDPPKSRAIEPRPSPTAKVIALPRVGGLHHRYTWREERAA